MFKKRKLVKYIDKAFSRAMSARNIAEDFESNQVSDGNASSSSEDSDEEKTVPNRGVLPHPRTALTAKIQRELDKQTTMINASNRQTNKRGPRCYSSQLKFIERPGDVGDKIVLKIKSRRVKGHRKAPYVLPSKIWKPEDSQKVETIPSTSKEAQGASKPEQPKQKPRKRPRLRGWRDYTHRSSLAESDGVSEELVWDGKSAKPRTRREIAMDELLTRRARNTVHKRMKECL